MFLLSALRQKFVLANNIEMTRLLSERFQPTNLNRLSSLGRRKITGDFVFEKAKSLLNKNGEIASDLPLNPKIRAIENLIAPCRFELTVGEIRRYRKLGKDAGEALGKIFQKIEPGETELEIARKVKAALAVYQINSVVTLVGADERIEKFRHPLPTENIWKKVVLIAVCAKHEGLIANLSRIACVGEIPTNCAKNRFRRAGFAEISSADKIGKSGAELYQTRLRLTQTRLCR